MSSVSATIAQIKWILDYSKISHIHDFHDRNNGVTEHGPGNVLVMS